MPHSLRAKLSGLRYKGILEDKDYKRLCKALDNEKVLEQIRDEIEQSWDGYLVVDKDKDYASNTFKGQPAITTNHVFEIIDKYINRG